MIDAIQSWGQVRELQQQTGIVAAASFKHTAPAGVALSDKTAESAAASAYTKAQENSDPLSSFGDFIPISGKDTKCAEYISKCVADGIIAGDYTIDALSILSKKKSGNFIVLRGNLEVQDGIEYRELRRYYLKMLILKLLHGMTYHQKYNYFKSAH